MRSVNAEVFHAWIEQDLLPKVPEQTMIVMDNASFHKRRDTLEAIEACVVL
ncbi:transposase [Candidatus Enterovibrio escicola]|uniref:transposase n=1 Tax=Candidatus Enterovibrio escicola TaxID=1927127 RepID=UPI000BE28166